MYETDEDSKRADDGNSHALSQNLPKYETHSFQNYYKDSGNISEELESPPMSVDVPMDIEILPNKFISSTGINNLRSVYEIRILYSLYIFNRCLKN